MPELLPDEDFASMANGTNFPRRSSIFGARNGTIRTVQPALRKPLRPQTRGGHGRPNRFFLRRARGLHSIAGKATWPMRRSGKHA